MKSARRIRKNISKHQGSTLLMVIICLAFLGILGSFMLSVSIINLQMKQVESQSKDNFYYCETAMEEIRLGLQEETCEAVKDAYREVLNKYILYAAKDEKTRSKVISQLVLNKLAIRLKGNDNPFDPADCVGIAADFFKYLSLVKEDTSIDANDFKISIASIDKQEYTDSWSLLFNDVKIAFCQNNYETSITSDLRVTLPSFTFMTKSEQISYSMKQPYEDYALVADGKVLSVNDSSDNNVTGNVYAGEGITVKDTNITDGSPHSLAISGKNISIATRGDIKAIDTAGLFIIGDDKRPIVWAENIKTETTGSYPSDATAQTRLTMNAICLIKDDLSLDARNSNVGLSGAYVGYTSEHTVKGSAIMINGSGSSLDLSGLSSLVLAGRAHIAVTDSELEAMHDLLSDQSLSNINILTGESLAFKSNQRAYLVPGQYIKLLKTVSGASVYTTALHNPITERDILNGPPVIDVVNNTDPTAINYYAYLPGSTSSTNQYKIVAKQTTAGGSSILRYYYLNFASGKLADQYLADYMFKYSDRLQTLGDFSLGSVKLPAAPDRVSAGNLMAYTPSETKPVGIQFGLSSIKADDAQTDQTIAQLKFQDINHSNVYGDTFLTEGLGYKVAELPGLYDNITHNLKSTDASVRMQKEDKVVAATVREEGVAQVLPDYTPKSADFQLYTTLTDHSWSNTSADAKAIVILSGDAVIKSGSMFNGFFMATGNITIEDGALINGIIVAGKGTNPGNVTVGNHVRINGRIIAAGDISLAKDCNIDCDLDTVTSFDSGLKVEVFLENLFNKDGQLLWKLFVNPDITVNIKDGTAMPGFVNIGNIITYENWRRNR